MLNPTMLQQRFVKVKRGGCTQLALEKFNSNWKYYLTATNMRDDIIITMATIQIDNTLPLPRILHNNLPNGLPMLPNT